MISQYFIGGITPESANPVQQSIPRHWTVLGWWKDQRKAIEYAKALAKFGRGEIRVLKRGGIN